MKKEVLYLMVRAEVESGLAHIADTVHEIENKSTFSMTDTLNVQVKQVEILLTRVRKPKN